MKLKVNFIKTTLLGGLLILLPLMLLVLLLRNVVKMVIALAAPLTHLVPHGVLDEAGSPLLLALLLITGVSFLLGLAMRLVFLNRIVTWIENSFLARLPIYSAAKRLSKGLLDAKGEDRFKPAVYNSSENVRQIAYLIEDHGDGEVTIMLPKAPAAFSGPVKVVSRSKIELLDAGLRETSQVISHWGVGFGDLLGKKGA